MQSCQGMRILISTSAYEKAGHFIHESKPGPDACDSSGCGEVKDNYYHLFCRSNTVGGDKKPSKFPFHFIEIELVRVKYNTLISRMSLTVSKPMADLRPKEPRLWLGHFRVGELHH